MTQKIIKAGKIYKINCSCGCNRVYIGSTKGTLKQRMYNHRSVCKKLLYKKCLIYEHAREVGFDKYKITLIKIYKNITKKNLKKRENEFIKKYNSVVNGLNMRYEDGGECEHGVYRHTCKQCNPLKWHCILCKKQFAGKQALQTHTKRCKHTPIIVNINIENSNVYILQK